MALYRQWKEKRGEEWSETLYEGIWLTIGTDTIIVSRLSHGLRPFRAKELDHYQFDTSVEREVSVPYEFIMATSFQFNQDTKYQRQGVTYDRIIARP